MRDDLLDRLTRTLTPVPTPSVLAAQTDADGWAAFSDFDLHPEASDRRRPKSALRPAAVLIAFMDRPDGLTVLLTRRADHLKNHAGQISFPGGRLDPDDPGPVEAALREAWEEVGLDPASVEVLGLMDTYETVTGFCVQPVVALVTGPFTPAMDPNEVAEIFEVPAAFLFDAVNHERHDVEHEGQQRRYYAIPFGSYYIWGATAAMLVALHRRIFEPC